MYAIHINKQHAASYDYQLGSYIHFHLEENSFKMFQKL